jgi:hypothetical protein
MQVTSKNPKEFKKWPTGIESTGQLGRSLSPHRTPKETIMRNSPK